MIKNIEPIFEYDKENGASLCILNDGINTYIGTAQCHPEDEDMESEKTGCEIALMRAKIKYFQHLKNNEIKAALKALKQVYYTMKHSSKFNPKSYENKMLWRQIRSYEFDLDVVNNLLTTERKKLNSYLIEKEEFYKRIRFHRKMDVIN